MKLLLGAIVALLLLAGCATFERRMIFIPSRRLEADPGKLGLTFEEFSLKAADGPLVHGWLIPLSPESPVILLCHGNGGNISHRLEKLKLLRKAGASVALFDYRGYGRSTGTPSEQGTYRDAETVHRWLVEEKKVPASRIVIYGESLGGGVAVELARRRPSGGLVLDSVFTSTVDMGKRVFPWLPVRWIVRFKYDSLSKIGEAAVPVLVMHSQDDEIIPFGMGRALFAAAPLPKSFFELRGGHNDGFLLSGDGYVEAVRKFLRSLN